MEEKTGEEIFFEYVPVFKTWYNVILLYMFQIMIFILLIAFFWLISSIAWHGAVSVQLITSVVLVFFYIYLANNTEKIRKKYLEKYGKLAAQKFWYHYQSYTVPIICVVFCFPLLLKTDYFLPVIIKLPNHLITKSLFPIYIALPLGIIIISIGLLMRRPSGGYGMDVDDYLYMIYPEKSKLITNGIYRYIRNPQYVCRGVIAIGFGVIANNISAIAVGLIHFLSYCAIIPAEDRELFRRFGKDFEIYQKKVPAIFPKYGNWKKFARSVFVGEKRES